MTLFFRFTLQMYNTFTRKKNFKRHFFKIYLLFIKYTDVKVRYYIKSPVVCKIFLLIQKYEISAPVAIPPKWAK